MKKILIIILIAFTATSILTIIFTFQASSTFRNFTDDDDDDDDNGDDSIDNLGFEEKRDRKNTQISILIDQINQYWKKEIITFKKLYKTNLK